jgi:hypothetical protein
MLHEHMFTQFAEVVYVTRRNAANLGSDPGTALCASVRGIQFNEIASPLHSQKQ